MMKAVMGLTVQLGETNVMDGPEISAVILDKQQCLSDTQDEV